MNNGRQAEVDAGCVCGFAQGTKVQAFLLAIASIFVLSACATTVSPVSGVQRTTVEQISFPEPGQVVTVGLGDLVVAEGRLVSGPALVVSDYVTFNKGVGDASVMTCGVTVHPGTYPQRGDYTGNDSRQEPVSAMCFGPASPRLTLWDGSMNWNCNGQVVPDIYICREDVEGRYFLAMGPAGRVPLLQDAGRLEIVAVTLSGSDDKIQELIYGGRVDDWVRFVYRERSGPSSGTVFSQDVQYNLAESSEIVFRSLRLEILSATNVELVYRLLSGF